MKNKTVYNKYSKYTIENYIHLGNDIVDTESEPIWKLKRVYTIILEKLLYEN